MRWGCLFVGCLLNVPVIKYAGVFKGWICSDNFTCCHTETEVADETFFLTQSQHTDQGQPIPALTLQCQAPGRVATGEPIPKSLVWLDPEKSPWQKQELNTGSATLKADILSTRPTGRSRWGSVYRTF